MSDSSSTTPVAGDDARRRWWQFNLKGLFAAVTLIALFLGWLGYDRGWWRPRRSNLAAEAVREAAQRAYYEETANFDAGIATFEQVCQWSQRWMEAQRAVAANRDDEATAALAHLQRIDQLRQRANTRNAAAAAYHFAKARALLEQLQPNASIDERLTMMRGLQGSWDVQSVDPPNSTSFGDMASVDIVGGERIWFRFRGGGASWAFLTIDTSASPAAFDAHGFNDDYSVSYEGTLALDGDRLTLHVMSPDAVNADASRSAKPVTIELKRRKN